MPSKPSCEYLNTFRAVFKPPKSSDDSSNLTFQVILRNLGSATAVALPINSQTVPVRQAHGLTHTYPYPPPHEPAKVESWGCWAATDHEAAGKPCFGDLVVDWVEGGGDDLDEGLAFADG